MQQTAVERVTHPSRAGRRAARGYAAGSPSPTARRTGQQVRSVGLASVFSERVNPGE